MTAFPEIPGQSGDSVLSVHQPSKFDIPVKKSVLERLLHHIENEEEITFRFVELVYVDEKDIIQLNREYLDRDYITDIISFRYDEDSEDQSGKAIEGTLYCCAPRIAEQSRELNAGSEEEFYRIFIHGLLHLAGYNDATSEEKRIMTQLENHYLEYLSS